MSEESSDQSGGRLLHKLTEEDAKLAAQELLSSEQLERKFDNLYHLRSNDQQIPGVLYLSKFQLLILEKEAPYHLISVRLRTIHKVKKKGRQGGGSDYMLEIYCKDFRIVRLSFPKLGHVRSSIYNAIIEFAFPEDPHQLFAFQFREQFPGNFDGWKLYNEKEEYERLGLTQGEFRLSNINENYNLCDTYPQYFIVPTVLSDHVLEKCAGFRTRNRMPAVVWRDKETGATITRCSQPKVGVRHRRSKDDEILLDTIRLANKSSKTFYILDSRPKLNAQANSIVGGGFESTKHYQQTEREFVGIENIHEMRDSYKRLFALAVKSSESDDDSNWFSDLAATKWLDHIKTVLQASYRIVELVIGQKSSVLVHCSDGWDRTAQMVSLAEIMVDPFYRTLKGFAILIQKEWCSFGHQFALRNGHGEKMSNHKESQRAPIFLQFMDCVFQLMEQFPSAFEFNQKYLEVIMDHFHSCLFGTFLGNSEKERREMRCHTDTISLWTFINSFSEPFFNLLYAPNRYRGALHPRISMKRLKVWDAYYLRWSTDASNGDLMRDNLVTMVKHLSNQLSKVEEQAKDIRADLPNAPSHILRQFPFGENNVDIPSRSSNLKSIRQAKVESKAVERLRRRDSDASVDRNRDSKSLRRNKSESAIPRSKIQSNHKGRATIDGHSSLRRKVSDTALVDANSPTRKMVVSNSQSHLLHPKSQSLEPTVTGDKLKSLFRYAGRNPPTKHHAQTMRAASPRSPGRRTNSLANVKDIFYDRDTHSEGDDLSFSESVEGSEGSIKKHNKRSRSRKSKRRNSPRRPSTLIKSSHVQVHPQRHQKNPVARVVNSNSPKRKRSSSTSTLFRGQKKVKKGKRKLKTVALTPGKSPTSRRRKSTSSRTSPTSSLRSVSEDTEPSASTQSLDSAITKEWKRVKRSIEKGESLDDFKRVLARLGDINLLMDGQTLLHIAVIHRRIEMVQELLSLGATYLKNKDGNTPLDVAIKAYETDVVYGVVKEILENGKRKRKKENGNAQFDLYNQRVVIHRRQNSM